MQTPFQVAPIDGWLIKLRIELAVNSARLKYGPHYARLATEQTALTTLHLSLSRHHHPPSRIHTQTNVSSHIFKRRAKLIMNNVPHIHTIKSRKGQHKIITSSQT